MHTHDNTLIKPLIFCNNTLVCTSVSHHDIVMCTYYHGVYSISTKKRLASLCTPLITLTYITYHTYFLTCVHVINRVPLMYYMSDLDTFDEKEVVPPCGFHNLGFTCYFNSLLQSLLSCTAFTKCVMSNDYSNDYVLNSIDMMLTHLHNRKLSTNVELLDKEIGKLAPIVWEAMVYNLSKTSKTLANSIASGQQCAADGYILLLQSIEKYPEIQELFTHKRRIRTYCKDCNTWFSCVDETNTMLEVEPTLEVYTDEGTVKRLELNQFLLNQQSVIDADCMCSNCGIRSVKLRTSRLVMVPEILFVVAKKYTYENGVGSKLNMFTNFPDTLSFDAKDNKRLHYKAVAQIDHSGTLNGGHYWATCLRKNDNDQLEFFTLNDWSVTPHKFQPTADTYIVVYHITSKW